MAPQRADVRYISARKGGDGSRDYRANEKSFGKSKLLGKLLKTFHVEEEKLDEEIYDTDGGNRPGML